MKIKHLARILLAIWVLWGMYYVLISHNQAHLPSITIHEDPSLIPILALIGCMIGTVAICTGIFSAMCIVIEEFDFWDKKLF